MIYGSRASAINQFRINNTLCAHCSENAPQNVTVFGRYVHILWIPIFPIGKIPVSECTNCKKTIAKEEFSNELNKGYQEQLLNTKAPKKHWIGLMLIGAFILFVKVSSMFSSPTPASTYNGPLSESALNADYRAGYLETDMYSMTKNPMQVSDSSAFLIKSFFDDFLTDEVDKANIEYFTRAQGNNHITLLRIPEFDRFADDDKRGLLDMVQTLLDTQENLTDRQKYIGIFNEINLKAVKTPETKMVSSTVPKNYIYEFYGEKKTE